MSRLDLEANTGDGHVRPSGTGIVRDRTRGSDRLVGDGHEILTSRCRWIGCPMAPLGLASGSIPSRGTGNPETALGCPGSDVAVAGGS